MQPGNENTNNYQNNNHSNKWDKRTNHLTRSNQNENSLNGTVGFNFPNEPYQIDHETMNNQNKVFSQQFLQGNASNNKNAISANTLNGNTRNNKYFYDTNTSGYNTIQAKITTENYFTDTNSNLGSHHDFEENLSNIIHREENLDSDNQGVTTDFRGSGNMYGELGKNVMDYTNKNNHPQNYQREIYNRNQADENNSNLVNIANGILNSEIMQKFNNSNKGPPVHKSDSLNNSLLNSTKTEEMANYQHQKYNEDMKNYQHQNYNEEMSNYQNQKYVEKKMNTLQYENYISSNNTQSLAMRGVVGSEDQYDKKSSRRTPRNQVGNIGHNDQNRIFSINSTNDNLKFGTMNLSSVSRQIGQIPEIREDSDRQYDDTRSPNHDNNQNCNLRKTHAHSIASSEFSAFHFNDEMKDFFKEEFRNKNDQDTFSNQNSHVPDLISSSR